METLPADLGPEPSIADDLDEAILVGRLGDDETTPAPVRAWYPTSDAEAEWCLRKYAAVEAREAEIRAQYAVWREPVDAWQDAELARLIPAKRFFDSRLQTYALARRAADPKAGKTTRLPSGSVSTRGGGDPKVVVVDEDAVIKWAGNTFTGDEYDAVVATKESVKVTGLREAVVVRRTPPLLSPAEWEDVTGISIVDPSGWREEGDDPDMPPPAWEGRIDEVTFRLWASLSLTAPIEPRRPAPPDDCVVVLAATGEVVPGVDVEFPDVTATVKVDR